MADLNTTAEKPRRRSYNTETGDTIPSITDEFRPVPLGFSRTGEADEQIRAFAVSIRNRSDRPIYVKESPEGEGARVDRYESFDIWESNGISRIFLKGEEGGEEIEIRTLEAHNDFGIRDKIDAFVRAVSHFLSSNKQETTITNAETVLPISGDVDVTNDELNITGDVIAQIQGGVTVDNDVLDVAGDINVTNDELTVAGDVGITNDVLNVTGDVSADVTGDVGITNDVLNIAGDVGINTESENAEIRTELTDSLVEQDINIQNASVGDLRVADRTAETEVTALRFKNQATDGDGNPNILQAFIFVSAPFDGYLQNYTVRHYADPDTYDETGDGFPVLNKVAVQPELNEGDGWEPAVNRDYLSAEQIRLFGRGSSEVELMRMDSGHEVVYRLEPNQKIEFQEGDGLRFIIGAFDIVDDFEGDTVYVPPGLSETDRWITEISATFGEVARETNIDGTE